MKTIEVHLPDFEKMLEGKTIQKVNYVPLYASTSTIYFTDEWRLEIDGCGEHADMILISPDREIYTLIEERID